MTLSINEENRFFELLERRDIRAAFGVLSEHSNLRRSELPRVNDPTLKKLCEKPEVLREFCLGLTSPSDSVRAFCKRYLPRAGSHAGLDILGVALESMDPFRPSTVENPGILGSFGGYASPVAQHIVTAKMKTEANAHAVYSEAGKYAKEVVELAADVLHAIRFDLVLLLKEYMESFARSPMDQEDLPRRPWDPGYFQASEHRESDYLFHKLYRKVDSFLYDEAREPNPLLVGAAEFWSRGRLHLENEEPADPAAAALKRKFQFLRETDKVVSRRRVRYFAERLLLVYPKQQRIDLYHQLLKGLETATPPPNEVEWAEGRLLEYLKKFPDEVEAREFKNRMERRKLERELGMKNRLLASPEQLKTYVSLGFSRKSLGTEVEKIEKRLMELAAPAADAETKFGARTESVRSILSALSSDLRLPGLWKEVADDVSRKFQLTPAGGGSREAETALREYVALAVQYESAGIIPEAELGMGKRGTVLFQVLCDLALAHLTELKALRAKGSVPTPVGNHTSAQKFYFGDGGVLARTLVAALLLLPDKQIRQWADFWEKNVGLYQEHYFADTFDQLIDAYESRNTAAIPLLERFLNPGNTHPAGHEAWQRLLALLYRRPEPEAHHAVREVIRAIALPKAKGTYSFDQWNEPYQWLLSEAWRRKDIPLFAAALERCALSFYKKGTKTLMPVVEVLRKDSHSPSTRITDESYSLEEVWELVREKEPAAIPRILKTAFALADLEKLPREILPLAAKTGDLNGSHIREVAALLESPQGVVCSTARTVLKCNPQIAAGQIDLVLPALKRMLASSASGTARQAAELLGILGAAFPDIRNEVGQLLLGALNDTNSALQEQVLKSLKKSRIKLEGKEVQWIENLRGKNPRRFGKLCDALM